MFQLFPDSIFFTSWLEKMKILLIVLQNSLHDFSLKKTIGMIFSKARMLKLMSRIIGAI